MKNALHGATMLAASFAIALVTALGVSGPQGFTSQGNVHLPTTGTYSSLQAERCVGCASDLQQRSGCTRKRSRRHAEGRAMLARR